MKKNLVVVVFPLLLFTYPRAQHFIAEKKEAGAFAIVSGKEAVSIFVDPKDHVLVLKAAALLQQDIERVSGTKPQLLHTLAGASRNVIVIGSLDRSGFIKRLAEDKKLNTDSIQEKWEAYRLGIVAAPFEGVENALVIAGSDRRGTAFGVFELSQQIGVSPWYWWADVPVKKKDQWPAEKSKDYTRIWGQKQFGEKHASSVAKLIKSYTRYNSRRKPELLSPDTYSLFHYREAETVVSDYNKLLAQAESINNNLSKEYRDAFYQLVLHPVQASANLNELYLTVAKNRWYAKQQRAATNELADKARALFAKDSAMSHYYNKVLAGGKWNHMMDQTHIGYTYWQQPQKDRMPDVVRIETPGTAEMGVSVEGSDAWWPNETAEPVLSFSSFYPEPRYIEIFNRGSDAFNYTVETGVPWINVSSSRGSIENEKRLWISVNWNKVPAGRQIIPIVIKGPADSRVTVKTVINNPASARKNGIKGFVENNGVVSIEAEHFSKAVNGNGVTWKVITDAGRTLSAITPFPVNAKKQEPGTNGPRLEYQMYVFDTGTVKAHAYFSPTLNYYNNDGLQYAVSIDDEQPQLVTINKDDNNTRIWEGWVANNIIIKTSGHDISKAGKHLLKFWMVDPGVVLQKLVVDLGGMKPSYLGPPETLIK